MSIHTFPSKTAKYFVIVSNGKNLSPIYCKNPTICSFYGAGFYSTTRKDAYDLANYLYKRHPNRIYSVQCLNYIENLFFGE